MSFRKAIEATPAIHDRYERGLQALKDADKAHVGAQDTRRLTGSVSLDDALKSVQRNANRWDYGIGHQPNNHKAEMVYWVEIHPATDGEMKSVVAKAQWLLRFLGEAKHLNALRRRLIWISSGKTSFTPGALQRSNLARHGVVQVGSRFVIPNAAE